MKPHNIGQFFNTLASSKIAPFVVGAAIGLAMAAHTLSGIPANGLSGGSSVSLPTPESSQSQSFGNEAFVDMIVCSSDASQHVRASVLMGYDQHLPGDYAQKMMPAAKSSLDYGMSEITIGQAMLNAGLVAVPGVKTPTLDVNSLRVDKGCPAGDSWSVDAVAPVNQVAPSANSLRYSR